MVFLRGAVFCLNPGDFYHRKVCSLTVHFKGYTGLSLALPAVATPFAGQFQKRGLLMLRLSLLSAVGILSLCAVPSADAAILFADNFETESYGTNTTLDNWSVSDGTIDVVGTGFFPGLCDPASGSSPSPAHCVDMDGSTGNAGTITSNLSFNFLPGSYTLSFWAAGNQRGTPSDSMAVSIGSLFSGTLSLNPADPWMHFINTFTVLAPETAPIVFNHAGGDNVGILLDDVVLSSDVQAVPEPMSLTLLGTGLAALGYKRRRTGKA